MGHWWIVLECKDLLNRRGFICRDHCTTLRKMYLVELDVCNKTDLVVGEDVVDCKSHTHAEDVFGRLKAENRGAERLEHV